MIKSTCGTRLADPCALPPPPKQSVARHRQEFHTDRNDGGGLAKSNSAGLALGASAKLILGQRHKNNSQNSEGRSPYQIPPWMRWDDSTDGPCQRQTPNLAPDGKNTASYSYQAEHNPNWAAAHTDKLARAIPHNECPADNDQYSSGRWFPCLHRSFNLQDQHGPMRATRFTHH